MSRAYHGESWNEIADKEDALGADIGSGVYIRFWTRSGTEKHCGLIESHREPGGTLCQGSVTFDLPENPQDERPRWTVEQEEPLTLSPSLLCTRCGHHGFIRGGKWVPA